MPDDPSRAAWLQQARDHLRAADPVMARLIDDRPAFDPRAWMAQLPPMDLYGACCSRSPAALTAVPGIGPWTVQGALIIALQREDVVLPGDLALRNAVRAAYGLGRLPTEQEVLAIAESWRPYRSLGTSYLLSAAFEAAGEAPGAFEPAGEAPVALDARDVLGEQDAEARALLYCAAEIASYPLEPEPTRL